ncbi:hypothetical protein Tco_0003773 [Tanacetum coccineum]
MVASDDLRGALSVIFLLFAHSSSHSQLISAVTYTSVHSEHDQGVSHLRIPTRSCQTATEQALLFSRDRAAVRAEIEVLRKRGNFLQARDMRPVRPWLGVRELNALLESALPGFKKRNLYFKVTEGVHELHNIVNSHVMTVTHDVAYAMTWVDLRKKMTDKYCPRNEMKKLKAELWNLKVIGHTLLDRVKRNNMGDLDPYAQNAITTMMVRVLQSATNATNLATSPVTGHFRKECPKLKNNKGNRGNQDGGQLPSKIPIGDHLSTAFSSQMDIMPSTLDHY